MAQNTFDGDLRSMSFKVLMPLMFILLTGVGAAAAAGFQNIDVTTGQQMLQQRGDALILLDVRTPQEFFQARLEGAKLLPINLPEATYYQRLMALPKDKAYLVYCMVGSRSHKVAEDMVRLGFGEVYNLSGGIAAWYRSGYPILQGAP